MTTLITGATGFVGSAVLRVLLQAKHKVRALVRNNSDTSNLHGLEVETVTADLSEPDSLANAINGCDKLFHVAADYRLWVPDPKLMYRTNVEGTKQLMLAALNAGVKRIVYTSSVATLGLNKDGTPADENTPSNINQMIGHYKISKFLAEQEILRMVDHQKLPAIIVNPSTPIGPRDIKPTPTGKIVLDTIRNRMPAYVDTGLNIAHVDDVAQGHLLAFEKGVIGQRYILGGDDLSLQQILQLICQHVNKRPPVIQLPHNLLLPVAWLMEKLARLSNTTPRATVDEIMMAKKKMYFSSELARRKLGYNPRPASNAIIDAIQWFNENNYP